MIKDKEAFARKVEKSADIVLKILASRQFLMASLGLWLSGALTLLVIQMLQRH